MRRTLFCLGLAAVSLEFAACKPKPAPPSQPPPPPAAPAGKAPETGPLQRAPAWQLLDLNGHAVNSDQFKGKVVVLDFWATWCPPCREEIPGYIKLQKKYAADGLVIVGVSLDSTGVDGVKDFVKKFGINYPIVMGNDLVESAFGPLQGIPTTFIIDRDGMIRDRKLGAMPTEQFEKRLLRVLNKPAAD